MLSDAFHRNFDFDSLIPDHRVKKLNRKSARGRKNIHGEQAPCRWTAKCVRQKGKTCLHNEVGYSRRIDDPARIAVTKQNDSVG